MASPANGVSYAMLCCAVLCCACFLLQSTLVLDMADFYNDAVNEPDFNFKEDYKCWTSVSARWGPGLTGWGAGLSGACFMACWRIGGAGLGCDVPLVAWC